MTIVACNCDCCRKWREFYGDMVTNLTGFLGPTGAPASREACDATSSAGGAPGGESDAPAAELNVLTGRAGIEISRA